MTASARRICVGVAGVLVAACVATQPRAPVVTMDSGSVTGHWSGDGQIAAFLGIPFAAPPVAERRWQAPAPYVDGGPIDATRFQPACMQGTHMVDWYQDVVTRFGGDPLSFPIPAFSEDCLYLNVWTPALEPRAPLPVMVWIHGGSHRGGWTYEPNYIGDELARQDVVVVSIAYRVDVFGFFPHPDLPIANFGLLDQAAALNWVRRHIARYGGDPANVTVFGESAGASSIVYLLASALGRNLFGRAIHQSAGYQLLNDNRREDYLDQGRAIERAALDTSRETGIAALRHAPADALLDAADAVYAGDPPGVVIDGHTLSESVRSAMQAGRLHAVDLMIGSNADEWRMYLASDVDNSDIQTTLTNYGVQDDSNVRRALTTTPDALGRLDRLITAREFVCPSLELARYASAHGKRSYVYYFSRRRAGAGGDALGAYHGAELPYVFDKHDAWLPTDPADRQLGAAMRRYWTQFARSGDPGVSDAPRWPRYDANTAQAMRFGDAIDVAAHPELDLCRALARKPPTDER